MSQHDRAEHGFRAGIWSFGAAFEPRKQIRVGRVECVPNFFYVRHVMPERFRKRCLREPRGDADAWRAAEKFQKRPTARRIEPIEQAAEFFRAFRRRAFAHFRDRVVERWLGVRADVFVRPQQSDRLGGIADVVARQLVENRIDEAARQFGEHAAQRQTADKRCGQAVGQRGKRIAAIRIGRLAKIMREQSRLAVAALRVRETVEQRREGFHSSASSSRPTSASARALRPMVER